MDLTTGSYERCDLNRCTEYLGVATESEDGFTIVDLPGQGVFTKIGPAGLAKEVISLGSSTEAMIKTAIEREDFAPFEEITALLSRPFEDQPSLSHYAEPPKPEERVLATFCGT